MNRSTTKKYPAFLNLENKNVLIIGGGNVALEKLPTVFASGAKITIISLEFNLDVTDFLTTHPSITKIQRKIEMDDLKNRDLIFSATNNGQLNRELVDEAHRLNIWINSCDDPSNCDFYSAAVFDRGPIRIAVSTDGRFAGLGGLVKSVLNEILPEETDEEWNALVDFRESLKLKVKDPSERKRILTALLADLRRSYF
ncbi:precorrin-2 dehydrogenase/sirohydrochlorin ferrochelatase family protein [Leptospira sp. GIMC2001]|uniref:precorrin-2 dehydrogenase/sirohydrochlorin ferrochelatase family protein n=1 Tax=Leptospira sp. GIMC2001 TaxID=1513297 RepID=UPI0023492997|nr:bifunctional precorrin-2 dehydrogenase/sirohydrochlorin ferrochelatase [Leptospira sp. GIMC2001]WCL50931.1 bifunctional precorrin-2 dehydrogenase/sirohydrochlorin ferrochelatase [Leptospira sp. GIMC2001]